MERNVVYIGVRSIIEKNNEILLIKRSLRNSFAPNMWDLPGGHVDPDEPSSEGLIRETKEEVDIIIEDMDMLLSVHRKREDQPDCIELYFRANKWHGTSKVLELDKHSEVGFFDKNKLPDDLLPFVKRSLEQIEKNNIYFEDEWG